MTPTFSDDDWRQKLTPEQYRVLREKATETPFTGEFLHHDQDGMYTCAACGTELFDSKVKFESGSGWPSFYDVTNSDAVKLTGDNSHGMMRIEVQCKSCDGHLGHVFPDTKGLPTGMYYCINSCALGFKDKKT